MSAELLRVAAAALGPLVDDVIFVGGATIHLWVTEPGAPPTRATEDVDVICDTASLIEYYRLAERLRERGFGERIDEPVICRWHHRKSGLVLDVMPKEESVLGFSNPWFKLAMEGAVERELSADVRLRAAVPPTIIATKLAAWKGRGEGDILLSLDVHDILVLIDGRPELAAELAGQPSDLRTYVARELTELRGDPDFDYAVESALRGYGPLSAERSKIVRDRLNTIVNGLLSLR